MRVVVDARPLVGNRTGIGVHTAEIAGRIALDPPPLLAAHAPIDDRSGIEHLALRIDPSLLGLLWQQRILPRVLGEENASVLWGPHGTLPLASRVPAVVTVHDLTSITMPHRHELKTVLSFNLLIGPSLARAAGIAAVSRATADQVARGFGVPRNRIEIVPNGVGPEFTPTDESVPRLPRGLEPRRYVLYAGTLEPRKGIGDLVAAWEELPDRPPLVLCGDPGWGAGALRRRIRRLARGGDLILAGFVPRAELAALYRHALVFVYPSRDEGFGLPPLEAMASGAPVIAAAGGAIPEVVGEAAIVVPPGDASALRSALVRLLTEPALRAELRERGIERASLFSWDRSARLMAELIARVAR
ncbi:MAG TPA: glycosyltransferase family 1 protein [Thermoanaerobaculia bacterium]|nr:glycosyltransferase family 1 protein [Thermoanaerobaculia bacterium]